MMEKEKEDHLHHHHHQQQLQREEEEEEETICPPSPSQSQSESQSQSSSSSSSSSSSCSSSSQLLILRLMSKRRTWVCLFVTVYTILLSSSWNIIRSLLSWYDANSSSPIQLQDQDSASSLNSSGSGWPAIYASVVLGVVFGLLSMAAALAVAVPATMMTWITVLVLLTFCGKPKRQLVMEGKKLTAEITGFALKILIKEGNVVAAVCAVLGYFALFRRGRDDQITTTTTTL